MTTPRYSIPELAAAQAQKHVTVNEALRVIDAAMNLVVASRTLTDPPADPGDGDKYIPAGPAGGAWTSHENEVAAFVNGQWRFFAPEIGWRAFDQATARLTIWDGAEWADFAGGETQAMLGINTAADATNRLAVKSDAVLFSHDDFTPGTGDIRFVVNKAAVGNTASLLFQTGYSGRGEVGLAGSDALELKASADGVAFDDILSLDPASHSLALTLDGVERLRIGANGSVGIGTSAPLGALHIGGNAVPILILEDSNAAGPVTRTQFAGGDGQFRIQAFTDAEFVSNDYLIDRDATGAILHRWRISNVEQMRIDANGFVGIRTSAPAAPLHVAEAAVFGATTGGTFNANVYMYTLFDQHTGIRWRANGVSKAQLLLNGGNDQMSLEFAGDLLFRDNINGTEIARLTNLGRLGINTPSPEVHLHVNGAAVFGATSGGTGNANLRIYSENDDFAAIRWRSATTVLAQIGLSVSGQNMLFDNPGDWIFRDGFNGPEVARLTNAGGFAAVGIYNATTASAANVHVAANGTLQRSTSSAKYKADILDMGEAERGALMDLRPVSYLSTCDGDDPKRRHFGLIAEEVIEVSPSLIHPGADGSPEGVMYERMVPHLIAGHQNHEARIAALEAA